MIVPHYQCRFKKGCSVKALFFSIKEQFGTAACQSYEAMTSIQEKKLFKGMERAVFSQTKETSGLKILSNVLEKNTL